MCGCASPPTSRRPRSPSGSTPSIPMATVERITYGLAQSRPPRQPREAEAPLKPGQYYDVTVELNEIAQTVPAGHRLRLAVSTSYWPIAWPSPELATVTIDPSQDRRSNCRVLSLGSGLASGQVRARRASAAGADHHQGSRRRDPPRHPRYRERSGPISPSSATTEPMSSTTSAPRSAHQAEGLRRRPRRIRAARSLVACTGPLPARRLGCARRDRARHDLRQDPFPHGGQVRTFDSGKPFIERDFKRSIKRDTCLSRQTRLATPDLTGGLPRRPVDSAVGPVCRRHDKKHTQGG